MINKKALSTYKLIFLILAIFSFVIIISLYIFPILEESNYQNSKLQCSQFVKGSPNKFSLFGDGLNIITPNYLNSISKLCPSKNVDVYEDDISDASDLINDCWKKFGSGSEILGKNVENNGICVYCGTILGNEIKNFDSKLLIELNKKENADLKKQTDSLNLNSYTLFNSKNLPSEINEQDSAIVIYYTYNPKIDTSTTEDVLDFFKDLILDNSPTTVSNIVATFSSSNTNSMSGIIVKNWDANSNDFEIKENPELDVNADESANIKHSLICNTLIIPEKNY